MNSRNGWNLDNWNLLNFKWFRFCFIIAPNLSNSPTIFLPSAFIQFKVEKIWKCLWKRLWLERIIFWNEIWRAMCVVWVKKSPFFDELNWKPPTVQTAKYSSWFKHIMFIIFVAIEFHAMPLDKNTLFVRHEKLNRSSVKMKEKQRTLVYRSLLFLKSEYSFNQIEIAPTTMEN